MEIVHSLILGIIQGITEFVPISSTAHLIIVPFFLSWKDQGLVYTVALHFGSLCAILLYFRSEILKMVTGLFGCIRNGSLDYSNDGKLGFYLIIATIPAVFFGYMLESYVANIFRDPRYVAFFLFVFAILLYLGEKRSSKTKSIYQINFVDSLFFGFAQAFAIFPGVSRSGVTITGGLVRNYKSDEAAKFSFLLAIPVILGATVLESRHLDYGFITTPSFLVGILASFVSAFFTIKFLLNYLKTRTFTPFVIYRVLLSVLILLFVYFYKI